MRLRLFHKLFFLVAMIALLAALAMALVLSLNLKRGFTGYLQARDDEQLQAFVAAAEQAISRRGNAAALIAGTASWPEMYAAMIRNGDVPNTPPDFNEQNRPPPPRAERQRPRPPHDRPPLEGPPYDRPPFDRPPSDRQGRPPPEVFALRVLIFNAQGAQMLGPKPALQPVMLEHPIKVGGITVAYAKLLPPSRVPHDLDVRFLHGQYRDAAILTVVLLLLASIVAYFFARSGVARLLEMQRATTAIAGGDLAARVHVNGADEISAMGLNINSMAVNLQQLDAARRRWLAEISHELRTPLSVLVGELHALREGVRVVDMHAVHSLSEEAQRLERLVNDLHFLAVSDLSTASCEFAPCDAVRIIEKVVARYAAAFAQAKLDLRVDCGVLSHLAVVWDHTRVDQLLANVLSNSLRYTDAPGELRVVLRQLDNTAQISVDDSAPAVPKALLGRLFEPLFRVEASRARVSGGSGLGLAVCQSIVRAHGGSIAAASSELGGLCLRIVLPLDASTT